VIIATSTLAVGIHMPCKTAVFYGDSKFLTPTQFQQMCGRAGRRGYDTQAHVLFIGYVILRSDGKFLDLFVILLSSLYLLFVSFTVLTIRFPMYKIKYLMLTRNLPLTGQVDKKPETLLNLIQLFEENQVNRNGKKFLRHAMHIIRYVSVCLIIGIFRGFFLIGGFVTEDLFLSIRHSLFIFVLFLFLSC
jgi:hypothetical protein